MSSRQRDRGHHWLLGPAGVKLAGFLTLALLPGCGKEQSALDAAGVDAEAILNIFLVTLVGACILWLLVNGAFYTLTRLRTGPMDERFVRPLLIGGGIVAPSIILVALLVWALSILPDQRAPGHGLQVRVTGEQWWWRVEYWPEGAEEPVVTANEIRLPAGQRTEFLLGADRVIHSFWIPSLGGKMDMFPGKETRVSLHPERPGRYRGQCAEFCGASHAWMAFAAVVMPEEEFDAWLEREAGEAAAPESAGAMRGEELFRSEGCGACHAVRGTEAVGQVGPDLTHVGSRETLGAGRLGTTLEDFERWIAHTGELKPEVRMPTYDHLGEAEIADLAAYLKGLK
ncbi:cytochrome B [Roseovarius sp. HI0049]|nr:cytochrome B [Roseovarius sp. HI0049]